MQFGVYITQQEPDSILTRLTGVGQFWVIEHLADILAELVPATTTRAAIWDKLRATQTRN